MAFFTPKADYAKWSKADFWTVERGILLLLNIENLPNSDDKEKFDDFINVSLRVDDALIDGSLKTADKTSYNRLACRVLPDDFICWARLKGYSVPADLEKIDFIPANEAAGGDGAFTGIDRRILDEPVGIEKRQGSRNQTRLTLLKKWYADLCSRFNNNRELIIEEIDRLTIEEIIDETVKLTPENKKYLWTNGAVRWVKDNGESVWGFKRTQGGKAKKVKSKQS